MALWSPFREYRRAHPDNYHMWLCFFGWLSLFAVGVSSPSEPFRTVLVSILLDTKLAAGVSASAPSYASAGPTASAPGSGRDTPARPALLSVQSRPLPEVSREPVFEPLPEAKPAPIIGAGWSWPVRVAMIVPLVFAVFITFTPTNLLLLCCFGAALGSYAVRLIPHCFNPGGAGPTPAAGDAAARDAATEPPGVPAVIAMLHGLIVFAAAVAGLIVVQGEFQWDQTRGDLYLRLAATVTIFSIAAGTNRFFVRDLARAFMPFRGGMGSTQPATPAPAPTAADSGGPPPIPAGAGN